MGTFPLLTDDLLDTSRQQFDFTQSLTDTLGDLGTSADGFDAYLSDTIAILLASRGLDDAINSDLGIAGNIANLIDPNSLNDVTAALPGYIATGNAIASDATTFLAAITGPPTPPTSGPGGGTGAPALSTDCGKRTNQYGLSTTGVFAGVVCTAKMALQVLRVQDGPCTYSAAPAPSPGATRLPTITSFTLVSGDATVWTLGHHTEQASNGTPFDVFDIGVTPKVTGARSHFDAVGRLVLANPSQTRTYCISVDCIP